MTAPIPAQLRAELSQELAEGAQMADRLIALWRHQVDTLGEAEATVACFGATMGQPKEKIVSAFVFLLARAARTEVPL